MYVPVMPFLEAWCGDLTGVEGFWATFQASSMGWGFKGVCLSVCVCVCVCVCRSWGVSEMDGCGDTIYE
jgi:hypothetical protein